MSKKKKILFAAVDVGFRIEHYSKFIESEFGDQLIAESFSKYVLPETHYKTSFTYTCPIDKTHPLKLYAYCLWFFIKAIFKYNVFHFISGETILTRKLRRFELWTYKLLGKKVIMHFVGSDIRSEKYLEEKHQHLEAYLRGEYQIKAAKSEAFQLQLIKDARKYASKVLVSTADLLEIMPEATFIPVFLDLDKHPSYLDPKPAQPIVILHSPSAFNTKGSSYVHKILTEIKEQFKEQVEIKTPGKKLQKGQFYSLTRYELLDVLKETHIVIDQMLIGWYGLKSVEALSHGCEVFCYIEKAAMKEFTTDQPIHPCNVLELKEKLSETISILLNSPERTVSTQQKIEFINKHHNINSRRDFLEQLWLH